jgi:hypothetical protein
VAATMEETGPVTTADPVHFDYRAGSCGVDPYSDTDRASYLIQRWHMNDPGFPDGAVYTGTSPVHTFSAPGTYDVTVAVTYIAWAVTRHDTVRVVVEAAP